MGPRFFGITTGTVLPLLVAACSLPAFGTPVDFTTTGTFTCGAATVGCSTSLGGSKVTITNNGNTLTITATGFTNLNVFPADDQLNPVSQSPYDDVNIITFDTTSTNHASPAGGVKTAGLTFTLNIDQTSPAIAPDTGNLSGSFTGSIDAKGSNTIVTFSNSETALTLGGNLTYNLDFLTPGVNTWTIPNPGINKTGVTTETATVTPEPAFMLLTGLGFVGIGYVGYRRRSRQ